MHSTKDIQFLLHEISTSYIENKSPNGLLYGQRWEVKNPNYSKTFPIIYHPRTCRWIWGLERERYVKSWELMKLIDELFLND